jgi:hypothetical protein
MLIFIKASEYSQKIFAKRSIALSLSLEGERITYYDMKPGIPSFFIFVDLLHGGQVGGRESAH